MALKDLLKAGWEGTKEFLGGPEHEFMQIPRVSGPQQAAQYGLLGAGLYDLFRGPNLNFLNPIEQRAREQFQNTTVPQIAERYQGLGLGESGGLQRATAAAAADLESQLASMRGQYGLQQQMQRQQMIPELFKLALTPTFETALAPRPKKGNIPQTIEQQLLDAYSTWKKPPTYTDEQLQEYFPALNSNQRKAMLDILGEPEPLPEFTHDLLKSYFPRARHGQIQGLLELLGPQQSRGIFDPTARKAIEEITGKPYVTPYQPSGRTTGKKAREFIKHPATAIEELIKKHKQQNRYRRQQEQLIANANPEAPAWVPSGRSKGKKTREFFKHPIEAIQGARMKSKVKHAIRRQKKA